MHRAHKHFMNKALTMAREALKGGEFPVGCVLVHDGEIVATGRRENSRGADTNELDHGEIVALRRLFDTHPEIDRGRVTVYSTMEPCLMCFATLLLNGVRTFVYAYEDAMGGGTSLPLDRLAPLYRKMGPEITIVPHVHRAESLDLFKRFFTDPDNTYWRGSFLETYTLNQ